MCVLYMGVFVWLLCLFVFVWDLFVWLCVICVSVMCVCVSYMCVCVIYVCVCVHCRQMAELLFHMEKLRALMTKHRRLVQRYHVQYLAQFDALVLNDTMQVGPQLHTWLTYIDRSHGNSNIGEFDLIICWQLWVWHMGHVSLGDVNQDTQSIEPSTLHFG